MVYSVITIYIMLLENLIIVKKKILVSYNMFKI